MGIFDKLSRLVKSNINDLISRAENPEKMLNQVILDMRDQLARAKREVAAAIADERKLKGQLDEEAKQARDWEHRAMLAVQEGRDDLAKQALMRQQEHAERAAALEKTWRSQASETEKLKGSLRQLNDKIDEAKRKRNLLIAKQKRAQAQKRIHETMSGLSDTSAFEAFNRMAEKIEESERRSLAAAEVDEALESPSLEKEFMALESGGASASSDERLIALKRQMGVLPPPEEEEPRQLGTGEDEAAAEDIPEAEVEYEVEEEEASSEDGEKGDSRASSDRSEGSEAELLAEFERLEGGRGPAEA